MPDPAAEDQTIADTPGFVPPATEQPIAPRPSSPSRVTLYGRDGAVKAFDPTEATEAYRSGQWGAAPNTRIPVRYDGKVWTVPIEHAHEAVANGGSIVSGTDYEAHVADIAERKRQADLQRQYGQLGNQAETAAVGSLSGLTLGLSDMAIRALASPDTLERLRKEQEASPWTHGISKGIGMLAPVVASFGAAAPEELAGMAAAEGGAAALEGTSAIRGAQGAVEAVQAARAASAVAEAPGLLGVARGALNVASIPQRVVTHIGNLVERGIVDALPTEAGTLAAKLGAKAAGLAGRGAVEGGIYGASDYLSEQALSKDPQLDGEKIVGAGLMGALIGGAGGALLGPVEVLGKEAFEAASPLVKRLANDAAPGMWTEGRNAATIRKMDEVFTERSATMTNSREAAGDYMLKRFPPKTGETSVQYAQRIQPEVNKIGSDLEKYVTDLDAAGIKASNVRSALAPLEAWHKELSRMAGQNAPAIEALDTLMGDIRRAGEANSGGAIEAAVREATESSAEVKAARAAEMGASKIAARASADVEKASGAVAKAEAEALQAERNVTAASASTEAMRAKYADAPPIPKKVDEIRAFFNTPEGQERIGNFLEGPYATKAHKEALRSFLDNPEKARDYRIPRGFFSANELRASHEAQAAIRPAEIAEKAAMKARREADEALSQARIERSALEAEAHTHKEAAAKAVEASTAAEAKVAEAVKAKGDAVLDAPLTFKQLSDIRKTNDAKVRGWFKEIGADRDLKGEAMKRAGRMLEEHIEQLGDKGMTLNGDADWIARYKAKKTDYRKLKIIEEGAVKSGRSQMKNRKGSITDYVMGSSLGHLASGPAGLGLGLASAVAHKYVRERGSATMAVLLDKLSAMSAIGRATERANARLAEGVDALMGDAKPKAGAARDSLKDFKETRESILEAVKDPQALQEKIGRAVAGLAEHALGTASSIASTALRAVTYLATIVPKDRPNNPNMPLVGLVPPSDHAIHQFNSAVAAVKDPTGYVHDAASGKATPAATDAFVHVYPGMAAALAKEVKSRQATATRPMKVPQGVVDKWAGKMAARNAKTVLDQPGSVRMSQGTFSAMNEPKQSLGSPSRGGVSASKGAIGKTLSEQSSLHRGTH